MYYDHWFEKNCIYRQSWWLPDSASWWVVFGLWISPQILSQNGNGSKGSVRDSWGTDFCKNPRKSASLPCLLNITFKAYFSIKFMLKVWISVTYLEVSFTRLWTGLSFFKVTVAIFFKFSSTCFVCRTILVILVLLRSTLLYMTVSWAKKMSAIIIKNILRLTGTQAWEIFWLRFLILYYFIVS